MECSVSSDFRILTIDGGGIRGVVPAHILDCLSTRLKVNIKNNFQMFAGTSTGSIIAAGLVCDVDTTKILNLYKEKGPLIFKSKPSILPEKLKFGFKSLYDNSGLMEVLKEVFQDLKLGDISTPLLLPSTDIGNGNVHVFKSSYSNDFTRDKDVYVRDAVLASCSAPIYFDPANLSEYALADGGLWANNPSLCAFIDAQRRLSIPMDNIKVFSVGTGHENTFYGTNTKKNWGFINGWKGKDFISFILSLQSQSTHNYLQLMMKPENLLRINFESDLSLPLDNYSAIKDLISKADKEFTHNTENIKKFLEIK
ncbi:MAG: patatin [Halobacteriovoraceae bacterium]|nr:patatin [Halobacteriovoraceae bacterium]